MSGARLVIWTRSRADWDEDRALLARHGLVGASVLHVPCVALEAVAVGLSGYGEYTDWVLTSAHAVAFFAADAGRLAALRAAPRVHTFGEATTAALAALGVNATAHEGLRTAEELTARLALTLPESAAILVPGAREPAFDVAGAMRAGGRRADAVACYAAVTGARRSDGSAFSAAHGKMLPLTWKGVACFASPSAVRGFTDAFPATPRLLALALGPTTASAARKHAFAAVQVAPENTLECLAEVAAELAR